jgi:hypothetical protein
MLLREKLLLQLGNRGLKFELHLMKIIAISLKLSDQRALLQSQA